MRSKTTLAPWVRAETLRQKNDAPRTDREDTAEETNNQTNLHSKRRRKKKADMARERRGGEMPILQVGELVRFIT